MGIFDFFRNNKEELQIKRTLSNIGTITTAAQLAEALELNGDSLGESDYLKNFREGYAKNPYVNASLNKKITAAKQPIWEIWKNNSQIIEKPTPGNQLLSLWNLFYESHFFTGYTWDTIVEQNILYNDLAGEYFLYMPDPEATLRGNGYMVYLEPDSIKVTQTGYDLYKDNKVYKSIPKTIKINGKPFNQILHKFNWNKGNSRGISRLSSAWASIKITNAGSEWNYNLLKNGARPSMLMMFDSTGLDMTAEKWNKLKSVISDFSGSNNAGKTLAIQAGPNTKISEMGINVKDMDFLNLEEISAKRISLALGVPPVLLGFKGDSTYSNVTEANKALYTQTIMPELEEFRTSIQAWIRLLWGDDITLKLNYDDVEAVALIKKQKTDEAVLLFEKGLITQDEARSLLGYEKIENINDPDENNINIDNEDQTDINEDNPSQL